MKTRKIILLLTVTLVMLICSCVTSKAEARILKKCVVSKKVKEKDSVIVKLETVETKTNLAAPGPTIYLQSPCDTTGKLKDFKETSTKNGITQTIEGKNGNITGTCNVDSLEFIIKSQKETIERFKKTETHEQVRENCLLEHRTDKDGAFLWYFYLTAPFWLLLIIYGIYKLVTFWRKRLA